MVSEDLVRIFTLIWIGIALLLFPVLLKVTAPYGRHSNRKWGYMISNKLGWFLMEAPSLFIFLYFVITTRNFANIIFLTASLFWLTHYFHRAIIFPLRIHTKGKKMPVLIVLFALLFNLVNATLNGYALANLIPALTGWRWLSYIAGVVLFLSGFIINQYHDKILIDLRKQNGNNYKIPFGGFFNKISCPNFFGEIIEWGGYAILCLNLPSLAFFVWTFVNLVPRAIDHHKWYRTTFSNYPLQRKAVFPKML